MSDGPPGPSRGFTTSDGARWEARVIAHGRASPYLSPKVARPLVQFTRLDARGKPRRYAALPVQDLDALGDAELAALLERSRVH
jgi:hypothetical protein